MTKENVVNEKAVRGFTLIELLVVILIIGILAAVTFPQYQRAVLETRVKSILYTAQPLFKAAQLYHLEHGQWPDSLDKLNVEMDDNQCEYISGSIMCNATGIHKVGIRYFYGSKIACYAEKSSSRYNEICKKITSKNSGWDSGSYTYYWLD